MVETSTVTPHQLLRDRLGTDHPQRQLLVILDRLEKLENPVKMTPAERLVKARAAKAAKRCA